MKNDENSNKPLPELPLDPIKTPISAPIAPVLGWIPPENLAIVDFSNFGASLDVVVAPLLVPLPVEGVEPAVGKGVEEVVELGLDGVEGPGTGIEGTNPGETALDSLQAGAGAAFRGSDEVFPAPALEIVATAESELMEAMARRVEFGQLTGLVAPEPTVPTPTHNALPDILAKLRDGAVGAAGACNQGKRPRGRPRKGFGMSIQAGAAVQKAEVVLGAMVAGPVVNSEPVTAPPTILPPPPPTDHRAFLFRFDLLTQLGDVLEGLKSAQRRFVAVEKELAEQVDEQGRVQTVPMQTEKLQREWTARVRLIEGLFVRVLQLWAARLLPRNRNMNEQQRIRIEVGELVDSCMGIATAPVGSEIGGVSDLRLLFTPREWEVWELVRKGKGLDAIAEELGLTPAGVYARVAGIKRKLGVMGRDGVEGLALLQKKFGEFDRVAEQRWLGKGKGFGGGGKGVGVENG